MSTRVFTRSGVEVELHEDSEAGTITITIPKQPRPNRKRFQNPQAGGAGIDVPTSLVVALLAWGIGHGLQWITN